MARTRTNDTVARPASDAYTGLLALSLIALVTSCVILYLDYAQYENMNPPKPQVTPKAAPGGGGAAPAVPVAALPAPVIPVAAAEFPAPAPAMPAPAMPTPAMPAPAMPAPLPGTVDGPPLRTPN